MNKVKLLNNNGPGYIEVDYSTIKEKINTGSWWHYTFTPNALILLEVNNNGYKHPREYITGKGWFSATTPQEVENQLHTENFNGKVKSIIEGD